MKEKGRAGEGRNTVGQIVQCLKFHPGGGR